MGSPKEAHRKPKGSPWEANRKPIENSKETQRRCLPCLHCLPCLPCLPCLHRLSQSHTIYDKDAVLRYLSPSYSELLRFWLGQSHARSAWVILESWLGQSPSS